MSIKSFYKPYLLEKRVVSAKSTTATTYGTAIVCSGFIQPIGGNETFKQGKGGEDVTSRLYNSANTVHAYGDKVTQSGQAYIVLYGTQPDGISGRNHHNEILLGAFK